MGTTSGLAGMLRRLEDAVIERDGGYREQMLDEGLTFQGFACIVLQKAGLSTVPLYSKDYAHLGDTSGGIEIKFDRKLKETGNLWIEVAEKQKDATEWVRSGLNAPDGAWLWCIGDHERLVLWSKKRLQYVVGMAKAGDSRFPLSMMETETSIGWLMPWEFARDHADKVLMDRSES